MLQETLDKIKVISKEHREGNGSISALCKKYGMSVPHYYRIKSRVVETAKPKKIKKPKFIDVPLQPENHNIKVRVFEFTVSSKEEFKELLGSL